VIADNVLDELRAKHRRIKVVEFNDLTVVFRAPTSAEYKMFRAKAHNPATVANAQEDLARVTVVHPSREAFSAILDEYPALCENAEVLRAFQELTGMTADEFVKTSGSASTSSGAPRTP
jgi:hypothetical protein